MKKLKVVFTGGGTGGHVYPNVAIYEAIKEKYPDSTFLYLGTKRGAEKRVIQNIPEPIRFIHIQSRGLPQKIKSLSTLISLIFIFFGFLKSFFILRKFKPDIIIGSGGYVAAPVLAAASLLKLRVFIHEQNAVPGRLNRAIARFATRVGVSFASTVNYFPEKKVVVTGYPLRKSILFNEDRDIKKKYKIPEKNRVLFIFGGSGGSRSINAAIAKMVPQLMEQKDLTIIWATGRGYSREYRAYEDTIRMLEQKGVPTEEEGRLIIREYFDNINEIYSITDLIISRAGAGTIKEITTLGIPSILVPKIDLPGDHQILNAREVEKIGGARIVYEGITYQNSKQMIYVPHEKLLHMVQETLFAGDYLFNMRKNLRQLEKQNSAEIILNEIDQIVVGKDRTEEKQIKVFYLHSPETEKNIELIFDNTTIGNTILADIYIEDVGEDVLVELRVLGEDEQIVLRRRRGDVRVNDQPVEKLVDLKEDDVVKIGRHVFRLKSYFEKVQRFHAEKRTHTKIWGSSMGITISRIGGFFRDVVIAAFFGAKQVTDIYVAGLTISNFMRRVVAENALENAFLPIYLRLFHRTSRKKMWEASSSIINFTLLISVLFTILGVVFAPVIIRTVFPGFIQKGIVTEAVKLTRIMFPYLFLITMAAVLATYLKAFSRFGIAEASAVFFSVGTISGILLLQTSQGIYSLGWGVLMGGFLQILFLLPFILKIFRRKSLEFSYQAKIAFRSPANKKYYSQLGPVSADVLIAKTAEIVDLLLASKLIDGSLSLLYYAKAIFRLPFAIISQAINTVILRDFSKRIALFHKEKAKRLFLDGIRTNIFVLTPVSILMIVLAQPIVSLIYGRGNFSAANAANTAYILQFYAIGLVGWAVHSLTVRIFSARIDIKTSLFINFIMLIFNIGLCIYLVNTPLTFAGLALATSISYLLFSVIRVLVLQKKLAKEGIHFRLKEVLNSFFKTVMAAALMYVAIVQARFIFNKIHFDSPFFENLFLLFSLSFVGISIYLLSSLMLKNTEILIFSRKKRAKRSEMPMSMLPPFKFLERVSNEPDLYKDDFLYKVNIYTSSSKWEIRNVGIKLVGLFKDMDKVDFLMDILKHHESNGFIRRNTVFSLHQLGVWDEAVKDLMIKLLDDPYYEVRGAAINLLTSSCKADDFKLFRPLVISRLKNATTEEVLAIIRFFARLGHPEDLEHLSHLYLSSNSLVREELLELFYQFFRRKLLSADEVREQMGKVLLTSNNFQPDFYLKAVYKKIQKEIE